MFHATQNLPSTRIVGPLAACVLVLSIGTAVVGGEVSERPLNFVILLADDLGWADLACYGGDLHATPNLDRFAARSLKFTDAYAAAPVCSPTRASVLTGKYPARLHMTIWRESSDRPPQNRKLVPPITVGDLPHTEVTLAEVLHDAGYYTAHVGKWHLGDASYYPQTHGFDVNIGGTHWGAPTTFFYPYSGSGTFGKDFRYVPHLEFGTEGEYLTDRLTSEALGVLEAAGDRPFFLNMCWYSVHTPIEAPDEMVDRYAAKIEPGLDHTNPAYAAMVESLDTNVGRILAKLDALNLADRTVVIFTSDNGGFINKYRGQTVTNNAPLRSGKGSLYEGGVRVPLLIRWPGVTPEGEVCREPVSTIDFYPTILQMAGLEGDEEHNATVDGRSLVPLLEDAEASLDRDFMCWHYPHYYPTTGPVSSIRAGDWKLIEYQEDMHVELYNLAEDLGEKTNLAIRTPGRTAALRQQLHAWRQAVDAQMPQPNPDPKKAARRPATTPLGGTLTLDGQPLDGATVLFSPVGEKGFAAMAETDASGKFVATTFAHADGAVPGRYVVTIKKFRIREAADNRKRMQVESVVPKKYSMPQTSGLTVEVVAGGPNVFNFDLTSR